MERRQALKNLGFGSMALFTSSVMFGALQGCTSAPTVNWVPVFFNPEEAAQLEKVVDGILPKTETPGGLDAGVANHFDAALASVYKDREAEYFKRGLSVFVRNYNASNEASFDKATTAQMTDAVNAYFKKYEEDPSLMKSYRESSSDEGEKTDDFVEIYFVTTVVDGSFWSYFTSELVGETVMAYDPIPVKYEGCLPYTPGQKSWSSV
ncbi:MAG: hypothetical protein ACJAS3_002355 [Roseivirga sp.]|jgi:hypothetical protein